jgi:hypothetical protein
MSQKSAVMNNAEGMSFLQYEGHPPDGDRESLREARKDSGQAGMTTDEYCRQDRVFERIQSLSKKEFALGGPMKIGPRMSENILSCLHR